MITPRHHLAAFALACLLATPASAKWLTYPEGLAHADSTGTLVLVEVYTDWCSYCKKLERRVLSRGLSGFLRRSPPQSGCGDPTISGASTDRIK